ncbi:MAG: hypothetical protein KDC57_24000, partial [Saprospiraceae bacterium]|nr:hypothetical protein [Saprospiraceae bacterium]
MSKTNFTRLKLVILLGAVVLTIQAHAAKKLLAGSCEEATVLVNAGDSIVRTIKTHDCFEEFTTDQNQIGSFNPNLFCKSVTHLVPGDGTMAVMINLLPDYILDGGKNVLSRMLVLDGHVDEALMPSVCANQLSQIPAGSAQVDTLFDSYRDGATFALAGSGNLTSSTDDGELTVVYYIVSASDGRIPFRASLMPRRSPPDGICNLSCQDQVTVSMNGICERIITPNVVLADIDPDCPDLITMLAYPYNYYNEIYQDRNVVDGTMIGQKMIYKVIDPNTGNTCWGYIKVEDKYPPQIDCRNITVSCLVAEQAANSVTTTENCTLYGGPLVEVLSKKYVGYDCDENRELTGYMARKVRATDLWGNFRECDDTIFIWKETIDSVVCPPDTLIECTTEVLRNGKFVELLWNTGKDGDTYLDEQGYAHPWPTDGDGYFPAPYLSSVDPLQDPAYMLPTRTDNGPDFGTGGKCMIVYEYTDYILPTCGKSYKIRRVWDIYDWCTRRDTQCIQWIKITDTKGPAIDPKYLTSHVISLESELTVFTDLGEWSGATGPCEITTEDFNEFTSDTSFINPPLKLNDFELSTTGSSFGARVDASPFGPLTPIDGTSFLDLRTGNNPDYTIEIDFDNPVSSFGFDILALNNDPINNEDILIDVVVQMADGEVQYMPMIPNYYSGFWGIVSRNAPIKHITFKSRLDIIGNGSRISVDNMRYTYCFALNNDYDLIAESNPHDCKAHVDVPDIRDLVKKDCDDELQVYFEVTYSDPSHPGKEVTESGNIDEGGKVSIYLPNGWHWIRYAVRDRCWNEIVVYRRALVEDNTPPNPVCDEITQVTLDPDSCWARVYAKDLDDGSHDNCCDQLHFAVASMDTIEYWRNYWWSFYENCLDEYDFHHYYDQIHATIENWIDIFVFDDYIDVTECGSEQLVLRVYEACDLPVYDPHTFYGGEHEWYWWNLSEQFAAWYYWRLNEYVHYGDPKPGLLCDFMHVTPMDPATSDNSAHLVEYLPWDMPVYIDCQAYSDHDHGTYPA